MIVNEICLSELESISSWDDYKKLEQLCQGKAEPTLVPVEVESSKQEYESESQQLARKKAHQDFQALMGGGLFNGHTWEYVQKNAQDGADLGCQSVPQGVWPGHCRA